MGERSYDLDGGSSPCPGEDTLTAFVAGAASSALTRDVFAHLDGCRDCREIVAMGVNASRTTDSPSRSRAVIPAPAADASRTWGRYLVIAELGRGAMGRVVRAYDPKLQREVALKHVLHERLDDAAVHRLGAEARAMAQLSHPNVVRIYDVETAGRSDVTIVMEYVAGQSLDAWLRNEGRTAAPAEIVAKFVAAGRGLAAAHARGLLHRDFKPANVMTSGPGTVKVTDFGLAKLLIPSTPPDSLATTVEQHACPVGLTRTGTVMGTPLFMAPEQHTARPLTPAADQYAFCVALWMALCGRPPFSGPQLGADKHAGPPRWPVPSTPRVIADALRRGLAPRPADRWPSMDALLRALQAPSPHRARRKVAGTAGLLAATTAVALALRASPPRPCAAVERELSGVWTDAERGHARAAVLAVDQPDASEVWNRSKAALDAYAEHWTRLRAAVCETATQRHPTVPSDARTDASLACLRRARLDLGVVAERLAGADEGVVRNAHHLVAGLPSLSACTDPDALERSGSMPRRDDRPAVEEIQRRLAEAKAYGDVGDLHRAAAAVGAARVSSMTIDYPPVVSRVALREGILRSDQGAWVDAGASFREALAVAMRSGLREEATRAANHLAYVAGYRGGRLPVGLAHARVARGLAGDDPVRRAEVSDSLAAVLLEAGRYHEAESLYRSSLATKLDVLPPGDTALALARNNLAVVLERRGHFEEAEKEHREALAQWERALGPEHPETATSRNNLANVLSARGAYERAEHEHEHALASRVRILGTEHPDVAQSHHNLASVLRQRGAWPQARTHYERALSIRRRVLGLDHPDVAATRNDLATVFARLGDQDRAEAEFRAVLAIWERTLGADHPHAATARVNIANALRAQGKLREAETLYRNVLSTRIEALGPRHVAVAHVRNNLALTLRSEGRWEEAEAEFRTAQKILERALGTHHRDVAITRGNLGLVLRDRGARAEATEALAWAIATLTEVLGPTHPYVHEFQQELAELVPDRSSKRPRR